MAIRTVREEGDEILRKKSKEVDVIDDKIRQLVEDMLETMHKYNGVGLAAVQIGVLKRIVVIDTYEKGEQFVLINPEITKKKGEQEVEEGCLSFPNKFGKIKRPAEVTVVALDENGSITHDLIGNYGSASVLLKKAPEGTGVIAGGPARAVIEMAGIKNIRTKSLGSNNKQNVVLATLAGLSQVKTPEEVARLRGKSVEEILG